jgi:hypothetical protein
MGTAVNVGVGAGGKATMPEAKAAGGHKEPV